MIGYVHIQDIELTENFVDDLNTAPEVIVKRFDKIIAMILSSNRLPRSMQAHQAFRNDLWIGYVTRSNTHWRTLFWEEDGKLIFERLMTHDEMNEYLA